MDDKIFATPDGAFAHIRECADTDEDTQAALEFINAIRAEDAMISSSGPPLLFEQERVWIQETVRECRNKEKVFLTAWDNATLVGTSEIVRKKDRSTHVGVFGITLAKSWRGKGLGSYLMNEIMQKAHTELGITHVFLTCFADNVSAQALYKKMGFVETGRNPDMILYKGVLMDEITMMKKM